MTVGRVGVANDAACVGGGSRSLAVAARWLRWRAYWLWRWAVRPGVAKHGRREHAVSRPDRRPLGGHRISARTAYRQSRAGSSAALSDEYALGFYRATDPQEECR